MDRDLDFLIAALSVPDLPMWSTFTIDQLEEMRVSFINLKELLLSRPGILEPDYVRSQLPQELLQQQQCYAERFKAGGTSNWRCNSVVVPPPATTTVLETTLAAPQQPVKDKQLKASMTSLFTVPELPSEWVDSTSNTVSSEISESIRDGSETPVSAVGQGDDSTDSSLALVPYQKKQTSEELVFDSFEYSSDYNEDDSSLSHTIRGGQSSGSTSLVSLRIPVQMEYVWCNDDFQAQSTDSDMTIIADGLNFIING